MGAAATIASTHPARVWPHCYVIRDGWLTVSVWQPENMTVTPAPDIVEVESSVDA